VLWGFGIGITFGTIYYCLVELVPARQPQSYLGRTKVAVLSSSLFTWFRIRDGWAVYSDGGLDAQYVKWRNGWDAARTKKSASPDDKKDS